MPQPGGAPYGSPPGRLALRLRRLELILPRGPHEALHRGAYHQRASRLSEAEVQIRVLAKGRRPPMEAATNRSLYFNSISCIGLASKSNAASCPTSTFWQPTLMLRATDIRVDQLTVRHPSAVPGDGALVVLRAEAHHPGLFLGSVTAGRAKTAMVKNRSTRSVKIVCGRASWQPRLVTQSVFLCLSWPACQAGDTRLLKSPPAHAMLAAAPQNVSDGVG